MAHAGAHRLAQGGRLIDRDARVKFVWNGEVLEGFTGDTLASALLGAGRVMAGRSFKYHRPRGIMASGAEEPNALVGLGQGARFEPNARATTTELFEGLTARAQNCWPSLGFDVGALNAAVADLAPVFPAGFYYKTFIHPRRAWKHLFEPVIRAAAGLGRAPRDADADAYEQFHLHVDVLVVGGGIAGLTAARAAAALGARVLLVEQAAHLGGRALADGGRIGGMDAGGMDAGDWAQAQARALAAMPGVTVLTRTVCAGLYDHGFAILEQRLTDQTPNGAPSAGGPRRRLWKVRARRTVVAAGAIERPIAFACNDLPGVMLASAIRDYIALYGVAPGRRIVLFATCDDAYRTALVARAAGLAVTVLDARASGGGALAQAARDAGAAVRDGWMVARALGSRHVTGVEAVAVAGGARETLAADAVGMSGGWSPTAHLYCHAGGKLMWDEGLIAFRPDPARAPIGADGAANTVCAGAANGAMTDAAALADAREAGLAAARACGLSGAAPDLPAPDLPAPDRPAPDLPAPDLPAVETAAEAAPQPLWFAPASGKYAHGTRHFVDFQNDVTAADVRLAAREGYESVEHAKRYTTLGMATDQGKLSNINGLALLAEALNSPIPQVGTTTFRPPYQPIALGAIAGAATGPLFKPERHTPMHLWHAMRGAAFEPVGDWLRPYAYPAKGEPRAAAVGREVGVVRGAAGVLDASTLGKIVVKGPDAGRFLDLIYTNVMSSLAPGRCRYGLMCDEQGFLFDDGVAARLSEDCFLLHTTSGGAERVHGWLEDWLQTEWTDLRVHVANVTEHWAQIALAGPNARAVLESAGCDIDLSGAAFRFFDWREGTVAGAPARVYRVSFTGELTYEIATPAGYGLAVWEALIAAGAAPYGAESLHVMRAEKGFIAIGDETDGTVTPLDLGLGWAVSKKKADFIGKRGLERSHLCAPGRLQLVGVLTRDPSIVLPDGAPAVEIGAAAPFAPIGRVTSTYFSPTLGRSIALALIAGGRGRIGETVGFSTGGATVVPARLVDPVFYDKEGERQNV